MENLFPNKARNQGSANKVSGFLFLPKTVEYQADKENKNEGTIIITPCYPGYGTTLGASIRRVLLSSLAGAAIDAIKIKGVKHEFSTILGVKEDVLEIVLNLKAVRLKFLSEIKEPLELELKATGEDIVKAGDINKRPEIEIVNPELVIANLTDKKANLQVKLWAIKGYGWTSAEEKTREGREEGTIIIDSIFSPVLRVSSNIENVRVGERNDYEKLSLTIKVDNTLSPLEAFIKAIHLLNEEFIFLKKEGAKLIEKEKPVVKKKTIKKISKKVVKTKRRKK